MNLSSVASGLDNRLRKPRRIGEPDLVAAGAFDQAKQPEAFRQARMPGVAVRQCDILLAVEIGFTDLHFRQRFAQLYFVGEGFIGMRIEHRIG